VLCHKNQRRHGTTGLPQTISRQKANNEAQAGAQARQAVVNYFLANGRNLNRTIEDSEFLNHLVLPVDCGDGLASREISHAIPLSTITISAQPKGSSFLSFGGTSKSSTLKKFDDDIPRPDFDTDNPLLFPNINFGQANERIDMMQNIIYIIEFLHSNKIAHNDLHSGNLLIQDDDYTQLSIIDFDQATCGEKFSPQNDIRRLIEITVEYLFGTTILPERIDAQFIENFSNQIQTFIPYPRFIYIDEELGKIKVILSHLLNLLLTSQ
jgi:hypothetical protein